MNDTMKNFSVNLLKYRQLKDLSQSELSKTSGIERAEISRWEAGKGSSPTITTLEKLATALDCTITDLLYEPFKKNRITDISANYNRDPELEKICSYLINNPQVKNLIWKELKLFDTTGTLPLVGGICLLFYRLYLQIKDRRF
jgi:transcriptional regulator with XRE-family HTH domain